MRLLYRLASLAGALLLSACTNSPPPPPALPIRPISIGNGAGSQFGNYENYETGQTHPGPNGPCPIFAWDRPISVNRVIRYLSASCKVPGGIRILDLGRQIVPMDQSPLGTAQ
ncbi:hypothetical protein [Niveispirillum sp. KHB5.9]|uniref:hypothetical protein n=1 Tax=Niveispirillum sp. KHB5.9 TaxID=3400269 RepID=UPI003A87D332